MEMYQKLMNEKLKAYYGCDYDSHPRFRIVFSDDLTEKRLNKDNEVIELPKYAYIHGRWVLEIHFNGPGSAGPEIVNHDHYEPLWQYTCNRGEYYRPRLEDLQIIINKTIENIIKPIKQSAAQVEAAAEEDKQKEIEKIFDKLQGERSFLGMQLREGEAVSFANTKEFKNDN